MNCIPRSSNIADEPSRGQFVLLESNGAKDQTSMGCLAGYSGGEASTSNALPFEKGPVKRQL